jgi:hypothetical protein
MVRTDEVRFSRSGSGQNACSCLLVTAMKGLVPVADLFIPRVQDAEGPSVGKKN